MTSNIQRVQQFTNPEQLFAAAFNRDNFELDGFGYIRLHMDADGAMDLDGFGISGNPARELTAREALVLMQQVDAQSTQSSRSVRSGTNRSLSAPTAPQQPVAPTNRPVFTPVQSVPPVQQVPAFLDLEKELSAVRRAWTNFYDVYEFDTEHQARLVRTGMVPADDDDVVQRKQRQGFRLVEDTKTKQVVLVPSNAVNSRFRELPRR